MLLHRGADVTVVPSRRAPAVRWQPRGDRAAQAGDGFAQARVPQARSAEDCSSASEAIARLRADDPAVIPPLDARRCATDRAMPFITFAAG
jgi:hypothetical protein